jgi:hypothetical protein
MPSRSPHNSITRATTASPARAHRNRIGAKHGLALSSPSPERHSRAVSLDRDVLLRCIDDCYDCSATCTGCADACLGEPDALERIRSIRLNLDCADVCDAVARVLTRQTEIDLSVVRAAIEACVVVSCVRRSVRAPRGAP